jgi:hypothetical protein
MINFTEHECGIINDAVRFYQMNKTTTGSKLYWDCDSILRKVFPYKKLDGIEPGYRSDT